MLLSGANQVILLRYEANSLPVYATQTPFSCKSLQPGQHQLIAVRCLCKLAID